MLLGVVAEGPISDLKEVGRLGADSLGSFQGRLQIAAFGLGKLFLEVDALGRKGWGSIVRASQGGTPGIPRDLVRKDAERNLSLGLQGYCSLHRILQFAHI